MEVTTTQPTDKKKHKQMDFLVAMMRAIVDVDLDEVQVLLAKDMCVSECLVQFAADQAELGAYCSDATKPEKIVDILKAYHKVGDHFAVCGYIGVLRNLTDYEYRERVCKDSPCDYSTAVMTLLSASRDVANLCVGAQRELYGSCDQFLCNICIAIGLRKAVKYNMGFLLWLLELSIDSIPRNAELIFAMLSTVEQREPIVWLVKNVDLERIRIECAMCAYCTNDCSPRRKNLKHALFLVEAGLVDPYCKTYEEYFAGDALTELATAVKNGAPVVTFLQESERM